jgi:hypothetical protein
MNKSIKRVTIICFVLAAFIVFDKPKNTKKIKSFFDENTEDTRFVADNNTTIEGTDMYEDVSNETAFANDATVKTENLGVENREDNTTKMDDNTANNETKIAEQQMLVSNTVNELSGNTNSLDGSFDAKAYGPNNNGDAAASNNVASNNTEVSRGMNNNTGNLITSASATQPITVQMPTVIVAARPPSPGLGGGDPLSVPLDDYYGLILVLLATSVLGMFSIKKAKIM